MIAVDVEGERFFVLFEGLTSNITNITVIFLVSLQLVGLVSQTTESVQHDTRNNVGQHRAKEDTVNGVVSEPHNLEDLHGLSNCP